MTASDGLFDVFKDKELIDYIKKLLSKYQIKEISQKLLKLALKRWKKLDKESRDDISFIILTIN